MWHGVAHSAAAATPRSTNSLDAEDAATTQQWADADPRAAPETEPSG